MAFIHSRIIGLANDGQNEVLVFENESVTDAVTESGKDLADIIKDIATIETINNKISKAPILLANMYHFHYSKLSKILDTLVPLNGKLIEGLIGLHLITKLTEDEMIEDEDNSNLKAYKYLIGLYENMATDEDTIATVKNMKVVSNVMYEMYWKSNFKKEKK